MGAPEAAQAPEVTVEGAITAILAYSYAAIQMVVLKVGEGAELRTRRQSLPSPAVPMSFASMGLAAGAKESEYMSEKIRCTGEPLGALEAVPDFLPSPEDLVQREEGVKVTIALSKRSVAFFKSEAQKHHTQYQRMIRRLLDAYAEHHSRRSPTARSARTRGER
jgi:hypothetical protein